LLSLKRGLSPYNQHVLRCNGVSIIFPSNVHKIQRRLQHFLIYLEGHQFAPQILNGLVGSFGTFFPGLDLLILLSAPSDQTYLDRVLHFVIGEAVFKLSHLGIKYPLILKKTFGSSFVLTLNIIQGNVDTKHLHQSQHTFSHRSNPSKRSEVFYD